MFMAQKLWQYAVQLIIAFLLLKITKVKMSSIVLDLDPKFILIGFFIWAIGIVLLSYALTKAMFYWLQQRKDKKLG